MQKMQSFEGDYDIPVSIPKVNMPEYDLPIAKPKVETSDHYSIFKELQYTEKTYIRDLTVLAVNFKEFIMSENQNLAKSITYFHAFERLLSAHKQFFYQFEKFLHEWKENNSNMQNLINSIRQIVDFIVEDDTVVFLTSEIPLMFKNYILDTRNTDPQLLGLIQEFADKSKYCYIPFGCFILKPLVRIQKYKELLETISSSNTTVFPELEESLNLIKELSYKTNPLSEILFSQFTTGQLNNDLNSVDVDPLKSTLLRKGSLYKLSTEGYEQRLVFLVGQSLIYTGKGISVRSGKFQAHGEVDLFKTEIITVEDQPNAFRLNDQIWAASTESERQLWLDDIKKAIQNAVKSSDKKNVVLDENLDDSQIFTMTPAVSEATSTTLHVCWHRNYSISREDYF